MLLSCYILFEWSFVRLNDYIRPLRPYGLGWRTSPELLEGGLTPRRKPIWFSSDLSSSSELNWFYLSVYNYYKIFSICKCAPNENKLFRKSAIIFIFCNKILSSSYTYCSTSLPDLSTSVIRPISYFSKLIISLTCYLCFSIRSSSCVRI